MILLAICVRRLSRCCLNSTSENDWFPGTALPASSSKQVTGEGVGEGWLLSTGASSTGSIRYGLRTRFLGGFRRPTRSLRNLLERRTLEAVFAFQSDEVQGVHVGAT